MSARYRVLIQEADRLVQGAEDRVEHYRRHVLTLQRRGQDISGTIIIHRMERMSASFSSIAPCLLPTRLRNSSCRFMHVPACSTL
jgi:hypothetical protein